MLQILYVGIGGENLSFFFGTARASKLRLRSGAKDGIFQGANLGSVGRL